MDRDRGFEGTRRVESEEEAPPQARDPQAVRRGERNSGSTQADGQTRESGPYADRQGYGGGGALGDRIRWGPIWAGLIAALATFLLLQLLALGIGLADPALVEAGGGLVSMIIGLIAFFVGGLVAGMTAAARGGATGLLNGFFVWALGTVLMLVLSALGLGQVFGALGAVVGQLGILQGAVAVPEIDPAQATQAVREASLWAFFGLLLSALAAALGGWIGGRTEAPTGYAADRGRG